MVEKRVFRQLLAHEVEQLVAQGCSVQNNEWDRVRVVDGFDALRVRNSRFAGQVTIGRLDGRSGHASIRPPGIENACIENCAIGDHVRIVNIGVELANYDIGDDVSIEDVGTMKVDDDARFGNGVEVEVLNEGGGREVVLFDRLSSQFAHLLCLHRYRPQLIEKLRGIALAAAGAAHTGRGRVGAGASIRSVAEIVNVQIGAHASVHCATSLVDGTILSCEQSPTHIGAGVIARQFIVAEGAEVSGGAVVSTTYVGQGSRVGRQFSAEGCLMFANCEAFHGEACSVFAGPYTVTHHKSSLLIAGMFSFYNAGSGTNQSNHMYKLGPVHEGRLERGSKTGSFSYMMWPCRVGPFSVVLGKHTRAFDTANFPFSHIEALPDGRCSLVPGFNLTTVGTVRDGAKWPTRDRRKGPIKRDVISFDVFSPYTVGRMMRGMRILKEYQDKTDRKVDAVAVNGAEVKRVFLRTGQKYYRRGILMFLAEKVVARLERSLELGQPVAESLKSSPDASFSEEWIDLGGQLMSRSRLEALTSGVETGRLADCDAIYAELARVDQLYEEDQWVWVKWAMREVAEIDVDQMSPQQLQQIADQLQSARKEFLDAVLVDATKEFDRLSRIGFGTDGTDESADEDFKAVRGEYESNKFVQEMRREIETLGLRVQHLKERLACL